MNGTSPRGILKEAIGWSTALSILMILAGILAIGMPLVAGIAVNVLVAWLLLFSALMHFVFAWHTRSTGGIIWEVLVGVAYGAVGVYLLLNPLRGLVTLTLALAIYLVAEGFFELFMFFQLRPVPGRGWFLLDAIITLVLAFLIWRSLPSGTEWVIGTLVGISMLFSGITRLMLSISARSVVAKLA